MSLQQILQEARQAPTTNGLLNITLALAYMNLDNQWPNCGINVSSPAGPIKGVEKTTRGGIMYHAFFGIPYAQPPLGHLRFKPPKPVAKFSSRYEAIKMSPNCLQNLDRSSSEDCLYLNVYRSLTAHERCYENLLPVLFYVHGGAFSAGSTGPPNNADYLMDEAVILVSPNYRLGVMGFSSFGNRFLPGNLGIKDLILALEWVKENIAAFGGDPSRVTVFGGSAGGAMSQILMKSPASASFVSRAYSYSGTINPIWSMIGNDYVKNNTLDVLLHINCCLSHKNCTANEEVFNCMQGTPGEELIRAATQVSFESMNALLVPFAPVIEPKDVPGAVIAEDLSLLPTTKAWMTSVTSGESSLFTEVSSTMYSKQGLEKSKSRSIQILKDMVALYTSNKNSIKVGSRFLKGRYLQGDFQDGLSKLIMDYFFIYPVIFNIKQHQGPKWMSRFEYKGELSTGTSNEPGHADQGIFLFNYRDLNPDAAPVESEGDYKISRRMIRYLVNFATYGDPTPADQHPVTIWRRFTKDELLRTVDGFREDFIDENVFNTFEEVFKTWNNIVGWGNAQRK